MEAIVLAPRAQSEVIEGIVVDALARQAPSGALQDRVDLLTMLLENSTSKDTQRTYKAGWQTFFGDSTRLRDTWARDELGAVLEFCQWPPEQKRIEAWEFQARLNKAGKSPATIQNRASAVRSLLKLAHSIGLSSTDGAGLFPKQNVVKYRNTKGIAWEKAVALTRLPVRLHRANTHAAKLRRLRDTAILTLLVQNGIRNSSLVSIDVGDFSLVELELWIIEKRKGNQKRCLTISSTTAEHIEAYLRYNKHGHDKAGPLFRSLHRGVNWKDTRITRNGLRDIVAGYGAALGLVKRLYPHQLRHTAISKLAKELKGDVVAIQEFSGHSDVNTVMIYARQARNRQGDLTNLLDQLMKD